MEESECTEKFELERLSVEGTELDQSAGRVSERGNGYGFGRDAQKGNARERLFPLFASADNEIGGNGYGREPKRVRFINPTVMDGITG
ncbi:unnamed protein product [Microthlaspi erraticum]|uniref:Uncharacterized protein n=1 Tax=Microthlaspi erraticum TaxID=1685480 RepID=A0A6D2KV20_9BRAS|nr:unnamed protein product [Microthlaspi erraticum]CAA7057059.1 unnamed protein product [Microthlaspi erraticum]